MNRHFKHQEGTILITVMISMLLIMGIGSALISHFSVTEAKEIEQSLAEVRIRWAMMSELNYMLSRARNTGAGTTNDNDATKITNLQSSFDNMPDITAATPAVNIVDTVDDDSHLWIYPENGYDGADNPRYAFKITYMNSGGTTLSDNTDFGTSVSDTDGRVKITLRLDNTQPDTTLPMLDNIENRVPGMGVHFCVGDINTPTFGESCEGGTTLDTISKIERVYTDITAW